MQKESEQYQQPEAKVALQKEVQVARDHESCRLAPVT